MKFPGDTHVKNMDPDLRVFIIKDLSQEKSSRMSADVWHRVALGM